jgi:anti-sigma regulatory factor (Ser/Thr protein kinase)
MRIYLPNNGTLGNIDQFLKSLDPTKKDELELTAHPKWVFVHPIILSMVAALGLPVDPSRIHFEKLEAKSKHYLERMDLFRFLGIQSGIEVTEHDPSGRFIPLTQIKDSNQLTDFITEMIPLLHLEPKQAEPIRYIVSELVRNVLEHAAVKDGAVVSAQYYQKSNTIAIGIVDTGVGIKKTITRSYQAKDDLEAIQLALMPGITGTTRKEGGTELNAGAGLFFIKSIAKINRNFFVIYSGNGMYKLLKSSAQKDRLVLQADPFRDRHSKRNDLPYWQGTAVGIRISLDDTPEFSELLDLIRDTYARAVRERKKLKYRKPQFV